MPTAPHATTAHRGLACTDAEGLIADLADLTARQAQELTELRDRLANNDTYLLALEAKAALTREERDALEGQVEMLHHELNAATHPITAALNEREIRAAIRAVTGATRGPIPRELTAATTTAAQAVAAAMRAAGIDALTEQLRATTTRT